MANNAQRRAEVSVPPALLDAIVRYYDPIQIILFGSQARGDAGSDSDWDLLWWSTTTRRRTS